MQSFIEPLIVDFDDFAPGNDRLDLLYALKAINPKFVCTLFAVPALGPKEYWDAVPEWCELVPHGWLHPDPYECSEWSEDRMREYIHVIETDPTYSRFVPGFKAPGWQISDGCYRAIEAADWWLADQHYNDDRRPQSVFVHCLGDYNHAHHHIQNVCGNGIEESWEVLVERVRNAHSFAWVSEAVY